MESFSKHEVTPEVNTHLIPTAFLHLLPANAVKPLIENSLIKETQERKGPETPFKLQRCVNNSRPFVAF